MKAALKSMLPMALSLALPTAWAQDDGGAAESGDQITLNFQDVDIRALINTVSEVTGKHFIVDPRVSG